MTRAKVKPYAGNGHIPIGFESLSIRISKTEKGLVGALIDLETSPKLSTVINVLARFTYHGETKLTLEKAMRVYREMSIEDLDKLTDVFKATVAAVRNEAAPPPNSVG